MAQAFTYAGAKSVVMSHWKVDDKATSVLMGLFYQYLSEGNTKDAALRLAQLDYLKNASFQRNHPFHWGAFTVGGNVSPLKGVSKWYLEWWAYLVGVILLSGIMALRKHTISRIEK